MPHLCWREQKAALFSGVHEHSVSCTCGDAGGDIVCRSADQLNTFGFWLPWLAGMGGPLSQVKMQWLPGVCGARPFSTTNGWGPRVAPSGIDSFSPVQWTPEGRSNSTLYRVATPGPLFLMAMVPHQLEKLFWL